MKEMRARKIFFSFQVVKQLLKNGIPIYRVEKAFNPQANVESLETPSVSSSYRP